MRKTTGSRKVSSGKFPREEEEGRGHIVYIPRRGNVMLPPYARYVPASHIPAADAVRDFMNGRPALVKKLPPRRYARGSTRTS